MTMPASQPVDYVVALNNVVDDIQKNPSVLCDIDEVILRSLAEHLTALREAVKGCGARVAPMKYCGDSSIHYDGRWEMFFCKSCGNKRLQAIADLTHTNPRDAHGR